MRIPTIEEVQAALDHSAQYGVGPGNVEVDPSGPTRVRIVDDGGAVFLVATGAAADAYLHYSWEVAERLGIDVEEAAIWVAYAIHCLADYGPAARFTPMVDYERAFAVLS